jgi:hypothetical protein
VKEQEKDSSTVLHTMGRLDPGGAWCTVEAVFFCDQMYSLVDDEFVRNVRTLVEV